MKLPSREVTAMEAATHEKSDKQYGMARDTEVSTNNRFTTAGKGHNGPVKKVPPQIGWGKDNENRV